MIFHEPPQYLNWVQLKMELGKEEANMASRFNIMLNHGFFVHEVLLL